MTFRVKRQVVVIITQGKLSKLSLASCVLSQWSNRVFSPYTSPLLLSSFLNDAIWEGGLGGRSQNSISTSDGGTMALNCFELNSQLFALVSRFMKVRRLIPQLQSSLLMLLYPYSTGMCCYCNALYLSTFFDYVQNDHYI